MEKIYKKLYLYIYNFPVFLPSPSAFRFILDFIIIIFSIYRFFIITIKLSFFITQVNQSFDLIPNTMLIIILLVYFIELIITINTGYYYEGDLVTDRSLIIKNKILNFKFLTNSISHLPYLVYLKNNAG